MARIIDEAVRKIRVAGSFTPGYRPPTTGPDALDEREELVVFPDRVRLIGTGGGAFVEVSFDGSASETLTGTATIAISGHSVVRGVAGGLAIASSNDMSHFGEAVGVTTGFAAAGAPCAYVASGPIIEPSWSWHPGPVLLGLNGSLTQSEPASGFVQQIGVSDIPTRLIVGVQPPFSLGA